MCVVVGGGGGDECVLFVKREFLKQLHLIPSIRLLADRDWSIFCSVFLIQTKLCTRCQTLTCHTPNISFLPFRSRFLFIRTLIVHVLIVISVGCIS